jgi:NADPH:quinone reductase-like Zn-dependent oxidoreductase
MTTKSMFAVYASKGDIQNPLSGLVVGERPIPEIPEGWLRVKVTHASLNRHDIFTLLGVTAQADPIVYPMIMGNDGAGTLDDGTEVVIYPVMGSADWHGDETLDPHWHIFSELVQGTFADYVAVPKRNAIPRPEGLSAVYASVMGTAWLTAYRMLFTKSGLKPGQTMLVQGATGGMATALIQLGAAAGFEVWVTSRSKQGREMAERLGAHRTFAAGEKLPRRVDAVMDNVGQATWAHSLESVRRGGTVLTVGITSGNDPSANLLKLFVEQITVAGTIMGTLDEMKSLMNFVVQAGIKPEIGEVMPMSDAERAFRAMAGGETHGKTVFTR